jgi:hypothetical protein
MKYYADFVRSGYSFAERCGEPDEFDAAMGRIALNFSYMEEAARNAILFLSRAQPEVGRILTVELSFRQKLEAMGSLIHLHLGNIADVAERGKVEEQVRELVGLCQKCEDVRNTYFHSSYAFDRTRTKVTAKRKHGLRATSEPVDSALLLDVADFIYETATELISLPIDLGLADSLEGDGSLITYTKNGQKVATYQLGQ